MTEKRSSDPSPAGDPVPRDGAREGEISLGRVSGVFGIRGEVRLFLHNRDSDLLAAGQDVTLLLPSGQRQAARLRTRSGAGKRVLGEIRGVTTPEAAQALMDAEILFPKAALPALEEDTYYHHQLLGLPVRTESGLELGKIAEIYAASSTQASPAQAWNVDSIGPAATPLRKPLVGEPPSIQPLPDWVA